ncbi:hypothetical protein P9112_006618 [Eukaryota sp. TZLM1-RC]
MNCFESVINKQSTNVPQMIPSGLLSSLRYSAVRSAVFKHKPCSTSNTTLTTSKKATRKTTSRSNHSSREQPLRPITAQSNLTVAKKPKPSLPKVPIRKKKTKPSKPTISSSSSSTPTKVVRDPHYPTLLLSAEGAAESVSLSSAFIKSSRDHDLVPSNSMVFDFSEEESDFLSVSESERTKNVDIIDLHVDSDGDFEFQDLFLNDISGLPVQDDSDGKVQKDADFEPCLDGHYSEIFQDNESQSDSDGKVQKDADFEPCLDGHYSETSQDNESQSDSDGKVQKDADFEPCLDGHYSETSQDNESQSDSDGKVQKDAGSDENCYSDDEFQSVSQSNAHQFDYFSYFPSISSIFIRPTKNLNDFSFTLQFPKKDSVKIRSFASSFTEESLSTIVMGLSNVTSPILFDELNNEVPKFKCFDSDDDEGTVHDINFLSFWARFSVVFLYGKPKFSNVFPFKSFNPSDVYNFRYFFRFQTISKLPISFPLTSKDSLSRLLQTNNTCNLIPLTFEMPNQFTLFNDYIQSNNCEEEGSFWIIKTNCSSRGRNLKIICLDQSNKDLSFNVTSPITIQKYIHDPFLISSRKFDLRLYVLVTACPFKIYLYNQGFCRFCCLDYSISAKDLDNHFIHLTNSSIQCSHNNPFLNMIKPPIKDDLCSESELAKSNKCSLSAFRRYCRENDIDFEVEIWQKIKKSILKSKKCLNGYQKRLSTFPPSKCFEIFGYDILLTSDLSPFILEVNSSPSLAIINELDKIIKVSLIQDSVKLMNPVPFKADVLTSIFNKNPSMSFTKSRANSFFSNVFDSCDQDPFAVESVANWDCLG